MLKTSAIVLALSVLCLLAAVGFVFVFSDYRLFQDLVTQCTRYGYIQDEHTRLLCRVPTRKDVSV